MNKILTINFYKQNNIIISYYSLSGITLLIIHYYKFINWRHHKDPEDGRRGEEEGMNV